MFSPFFNGSKLTYIHKILGTLLLILIAREPHEGSHIEKHENTHKRPPPPKPPPVGVASPEEGTHLPGYCQRAGGVLTAFWTAAALVTPIVTASDAAAVSGIMVELVPAKNMFWARLGVVQPGFLWWWWWSQTKIAHASLREWNVLGGKKREEKKGNCVL